MIVTAYTVRISTRTEHRGLAENPDAAAAERGRASGHSPETSASYDLARLAELSGVSARTIRFYQSERLLPAPFSDPDDGRLARYGASHLERLETIAQLQARGLKLAAIADLLAQREEGRSVADWLGYQEHFRGWTEAEPTVVTTAAFDALISGFPLEAVGSLIDAGLIQVGEGDVTILSPILFDTSIALMKIGLAPDTVIRTGRLLRRHLASAADELVEMFAAIFDSADIDGSAEIDIAALGDVFRRHAAEAAGQTFAEELERASAEELSRRTH